MLHDGTLLQLLYKIAGGDITRDLIMLNAVRRTDARLAAASSFSLIRNNLLAFFKNAHHAFARFGA